MLLNAKYALADRNHPERLVFKFEKASFKQKLHFFGPKNRGWISGRSSKNELETSEESNSNPRFIKKLVAGESRLIRIPPCKDVSYDFWIPSASRQGIAIVIGSLHSLKPENDRSMRINFGIVPGTFIEAEKKDWEREIVCTDIRIGRVRLLYIDPVTFDIPKFYKKLAKTIGKIPVKALIIDEAHLVSEWDVDFKPACMTVLPESISILKEKYPDIITLALTTRTEKIVIADMENLFGLKLEKAPGPEEKEVFDISLQIVKTSGLKSKKTAFDRIITKDIPNIFGKKSIQDLLRKKRIDDLPVAGQIFCSYAQPSGVFIINEDRSLLKMNKDIGFFDPDLAHKAGSQWFTPYYIMLNAEDMFAKNMSKVSDTNEFADLFITPKTENPLFDRRKTGFTLHMSLPESIEQWLNTIKHFNEEDRRLHCIFIIDWPRDECEKDMNRRSSCVPSCSKNKCPFDETGLCDFGRQHIKIGNRWPSVQDQVEDVLKILDLIIDHLPEKDFSSYKTIRFDLKQDGQHSIPKYEISLYRLTTIGLISGYDIEVTGNTVCICVQNFRIAPDIDIAVQAVIKYLKKHDLSCEGILKNLEKDDIEKLILRVREKYIWNCHEKNRYTLDKADELKPNFINQNNNPDLFRFVQDYTLLMLDCHVESARQMAYRKLWNIKEIFERPMCHNRSLKSFFQIVDESWECGFCDICAPDLCFSKHDQKVSSTQEPETGKNENSEEKILEEKALKHDLDKWLADNDIPFDFDFANRLSEEFSNYPTNIYTRSARILEESPRNIKALYLVREFSSRQLGKRACLDLIRTAKQDMDFVSVAGFYDTSRNLPDIRNALFDEIDDESGPMHTEDGEKWLYKKAKKQFPTDSQRTCWLGIRVLLNRLKEVRLSTHNQRLKAMSDDFEDHFAKQIKE